MQPPEWLAVAQRLQALAQTGLEYAASPYEVERYQEIHRLSLRMMGGGFDAPAELLEAAFAGETGYATPKVDIRVVVFRGTAEVLMVQEKMDGYRWSLPGGWADVGYTPFEVAVKELEEETGLRGRAVRLLALWDRSRHNQPPLPWSVYKCAVLCEAVGGELRTDTDETASARWVHRDEIGALPLSESRITAAQLHTLFEFADNPALPTICD